MSGEFPDHDILSEISRYDTEYAPAEARRARFEDLPDGLHILQVADIALGRTPTNGDPIVKIGLRVTEGTHKGMLVERGYPIPAMQAVLGGELVALGIDADKWRPGLGRPFSQELAKLIHSHRLVGRTFRGQKKTDHSEKTGKSYHNLLIHSLVTASATPTAGAQPGNNGPLPATPTAPARASAAPVSPRPGASEDDEIPF
jgi:hypothetical protein